MIVWLIEFHVSGIEAFWLLVTIICVMFTAASLADAIADRRAVKAMNGRARELVGNNNVRREGIRVIVATCLLVIVMPGLTDDTTVPLSAVTLILCAVPVLLSLNSALDFRERRRLSRITAEQLLRERERRDHRRMDDTP